MQGRRRSSRSTGSKEGEHAKRKGGLLPRIPKITFYHEKRKEEKCPRRGEGKKGGGAISLWDEGGFQLYSGAMYWLLGERKEIETAEGICP